MKLKLLSIVLFVVASSVVSAQDTLKQEAVTLLTEILAQSPNASKEMTGEKFDNIISERIDFSLTKEQLELAKEGKPLRSDKEIQNLLKKAEYLKDLDFGMPEKPIVASLTNKKQSVRSIESSYRMLESILEQKEAILVLRNTSSAKLIITDLTTAKKLIKITDLDNYEKLRFKSAHGEEDWIYKKSGFGDLEKISPLGSKVILIAPRTLSGKLIVACDNGSVQSLPLKDLEGTIDTSGVKK